MRQKITDNINNPEVLEKLYRENKRDFAREFPAAADGTESDLVKFWTIRLAGTQAPSPGNSAADLVAVIAISLATALLMLLPEVFSSIHKSTFYTRYMAIIAFNGLIVYFLRQNRVPAKWIIIYGTVILALLLYMILLPWRETDSLNIAFIHSPLFLWCLFGIAYISFDFRDTAKRMEFIRFNGELLTMTGLLLIAGGILTGITLGLFSAIGVDIEKTYFDYIVIPGGTVSPIIASFLIKTYPDITRRIVPVIARVFTPVVLVTLLVYVVSLAFSKIRILEDRNLLIVFNLMVVAVMALIIFSVTELNKARKRNFSHLILFILSVVTLVINAVALTAIISRLALGLTPNRLVVVVTNVLVFVNLLLIAKDLFRSRRDPSGLGAMERNVAKYLGIYLLWTVFAIFILPGLFGFN